MQSTLYSILLDVGFDNQFLLKCSMFSSAIPFLQQQGTGVVDFFIFCFKQGRPQSFKEAQENYTSWNLKPSEVPAAWKPKHQYLFLPSYDRNRTY